MIYIRHSQNNMLKHCCKCHHQARGWNLSQLTRKRREWLKETNVLREDEEIMECTNLWLLPRARACTETRFAFFRATLPLNTLKWGVIRNWSVMWVVTFAMRFQPQTCSQTGGVKSAFIQACHQCNVFQHHFTIGMLTVMELWLAQKIVK